MLNYKRAYYDATSDWERLTLVYPDKFWRTLIGLEKRRVFERVTGGRWRTEGRDADYAELMLLLQLTAEASFPDFPQGLS